MTEESYICYLMGSIDNCSKKLISHLKNLFLVAGIAEINRQVSMGNSGCLCLDTVDISDRQMNEQVKLCIKESTQARCEYEKWEFEKDYRYSILFESQNFQSLVSHTNSLPKYGDSIAENELLEDQPICKETEKYIFLKFNRYFSGIQPITKTESLQKYPLLIVLHKENSIVEFRFDTLRNVFFEGNERQIFYSDLIKYLKRYCEKVPTVELIPIDLEFIVNHHSGATLMAKNMMLPSGGNAQLEVGKNENYVLPILGELRGILATYETELNSIPALKEALDEFMFENDELSECSWVEIMWESEIKTRSIRVKFIRNYKGTGCWLLQHYANNLLFGMERMNYVVGYIAEHKTSID